VLILDYLIFIKHNLNLRLVKLGFNYLMKIIFKYLCYQFRYSITILLTFPRFYPLWPLHKYVLDPVTRYTLIAMQSSIDSTCITTKIICII